MGFKEGLLDFAGNFAKGIFAMILVFTAMAIMVLVGLGPLALAHHFDSNWYLLIYPALLAYPLGSDL